LSFSQAAQSLLGVSFLKKILSSLIAREAFAPSYLGVLINPFFLARREIFKQISKYSGELTGKILDVGCGSTPYKNLFKFSTYIGLEYDTPVARKKQTADAYYTGNQMPFENESFDCILCTQVLEHVFEPEKFLRELSRVAKSDARMMLTVPFLWNEHEQPYDFARYTSFGLRDLMARNGWEIERSKKLNNGFLAILQLLNAHIYSQCQRLGPKFGLLISCFLTAPFNLLGLIFKKNDKYESDLYLDNFIIARKI
jgi:SAM-dependent methyltransferase